MPKRRLRWLIVLLVAVTALAEARFEWRDVVQDVRIGDDGTVIVDDTRTLWTDEDFGEAFICLQHGPDVDVRLLDGSGAVDPGPPARAFVQPCEDGTAGTELVVQNDTRVRERRVRFVYALDGTVEAYGDVVQWYWNLIQLDHPPIVGYRLTLSIPGPMEAPYDAFVHRYGNPELPDVSLTPDRAQLNVAFDRIPPGDGVEVRYLMPPALFSLTGSGERLETFLRQEAQLARLDTPDAPKLALPGFSQTTGGQHTFSGSARDPDGIDRVVAQVGNGDRVTCTGTTEFECVVAGLRPGMNRVTVLAFDGSGDIASGELAVERIGRMELFRRSWLWGLIPLFLVGWLATGIVRAYRESGVEPDVDEMRYPFEPPSDLPPAAVTAMRMQNFSTSSMSSAFHATVMDLARRGFGTFAGTKRKFEMQLHREKGEGELLPFEQKVLAFLEAAAEGHRRGDDTYLEFEELKKYAKRRGEGFMKSWATDVRAWLEEQRGGPLVTRESRQSTNRWLVRGLLAAAACFLGIFVTSGPAATLFGVGIGACVLLVIVASQALPAWRPEIAREVARWNGFKRTLTDYTRMKDAPNDFFELWDVYFCYAAALGVAQQFLKTLERAAPLAGVDEQHLMRRSAWLGSSAQTASSLSQLSATASQLSSALSTASASASSGGSSSGGGGGGGGGGSSGGR